MEEEQDRSSRAQQLGACELAGRQEQEASVNQASTTIPQR